MIKRFSALPEFLEKNKIDGCFADTSILFSFSFPFDVFNESADSVLTPLHKANIPIFTNVNVKSEFLGNHRRVLIPECLVDFYDDYKSKMDDELAKKLEKFKDVYREFLRKEKAVKFDVNQIAAYRKMLKKSILPGGDGWEILCNSYLAGILEPIWDGLTEELTIKFISLRAGDESPYLNSFPEWSQAISIMGRYGIASNDAMILNMFLCSKIPILLTADLEMAEVAIKESKGTKIIFMPDPKPELAVS